MLLLGARSQRVLSTSYGICYGGNNGELVSSNWSRLVGEMGHTSVNDVEYCCKQQINIFKLMLLIKYLMEKIIRAFK